MARSTDSLITGCLEGISKRVFADYSLQIAQLAGEKPGIYALYHHGKLYYVGLATDLRNRMKHHLVDQHSRNWDTFSLYVVSTEAHLRDLEAMTIRIAKPKGNGIKGSRLASLKPELKTLIDDWNLRRTSNILGLGEVGRTSKGRPKADRKPNVPVEKRKVDTIVCPGHEDGFREAFLGEKRWYAIRVSPAAQAQLKYVAIYVTGKVKAITHYGRIKSIEPWKNTGKFVINLTGPAKPIGPIKWGAWVAIQGPRLTTLRKLRRARTLDRAL